MSNIDSNEKEIKCQDEKTLEFIRKARLIHSDKYDYSKVIYIKAIEKVSITCHIHGEFLQLPSNHLRSIGCPKCGSEKTGKVKKSNTEEFIRKAKLKHGDTYDYSKAIYTKSNEKVIIGCKIHGFFEQNASNHLNGQGCPKCADEHRNDSRKSNTEEFIRKAKLIHGDFYDYSKVNYVKAIKEIIIICPIHGEFLQLPSSHLYGQGCPTCGGSKKLSTLEFINRAKDIHGNLYDYSLVEYKNIDIKVEIICKKHGIFKQSPRDHLIGRGCQKCNSSKGEIKVRNYLNSKNIEFVEQKRFPDCRDRNTLPFDFYIPNLNLCIEFDGRQHFEPFSFNSENKENQIKNFKNVQKKDLIKNNYCKENKINLLRISYKENVEEKLDNYIDKYIDI